MSFNLLDDPWIPAEYLDGTKHTLSLAQTFDDAHKIRRVQGDDVMETRSIERLLIAITWRATNRQPWNQLWATRFPAAQLTSYLENWHPRFDLDRAFQYDIKPHSTKTPNGLDRLITLDTNQPVPPKRLPPALTARALLRRLLADPSGIRTGIAGDPYSSGGRSMPTGPGILTLAPNTMIRHSTLDKTVVWNLPVDAGGDQTPMWEDPPTRPRGVYNVDDVGAGRVLVWPGRRLRIGLDADDHAVSAFIANGDKLEQAGLERVDPHALMRLAGTGNIVARTVEHTREPWGALLPKGAPAPVGLQRLLHANVERTPDMVEVATVVTHFGPQRSTIVDVEAQSVTVATDGLAQRIRVVEAITESVYALSDIVVKAHSINRPGASDVWWQSMTRDVVNEQLGAITSLIEQYLQGQPLDLVALEDWADSVFEATERAAGGLHRRTAGGFPAVGLVNHAAKIWRETRQIIEEVFA